MLWNGQRQSKMQRCKYILSSSFKGELNRAEICRLVNDASEVEDTNPPNLMFEDTDTQGLIPNKNNEVDIQTSEILRSLSDPGELKNLESMKLPEQTGALQNESYPNHLGSSLKSDTKIHYPEILDLDLYRNKTLITGYPDSCISYSHSSNILENLQMCDDNACSFAPRKRPAVSNQVSDPRPIINLSCAPNKTDWSHQTQVKMGNCLRQKSVDTKKNIIENPQHVTHNSCILRKRLSIKIKERRKEEGKDEFIPDFSSRPTLEPSDEEKRKSQDLKMRNRKSANRSRENMKLKVKKLEESIRYYEESNNKLESKIKEYNSLLVNMRQWLVRHGVGGNIDPNSNLTSKDGIASSNFYS